jgi:hypothetical protein
MTASASRLPMPTRVADLFLVLWSPWRRTYTAWYMGDSPDGIILDYADPNLLWQHMVAVADQF